MSVQQAVRTIRRGLPKVPGGEPWPPTGDFVEEWSDSAALDAPMTTDEQVGGAATWVTSLDAAPTEAEAEADEGVPTEVVAAAPAAGVSTIRRGLPRLPGGAPWPTTTLTAATAAAGPASGTPLRRGLPRSRGAERWPAAGFASAPGKATSTSTSPVGAEVPVDAAPSEPQTRSGLPRPTSNMAPAASAKPEAPASAALSPQPQPQPQPPAPAPVRQPVTPRAARPTATPPRRPTPAEPKRYGRFTRLEWLGVLSIGGFAMLFAAMIVVVLAAWLRAQGFMQDFLTTYPGETHLPVGAPVGIPAWLGWQHFFNVFLMVLIIRSGLRIRSEKRPTVFWTAKWSKGGKGKISLTVWLHQALDILWLINGVVFVVMLFATGQWMRVVPTSWEVIPNALSAALQYVSLDWPTENGWVNYNSLQVLAYFTTIFIAAPLAAITGMRMSGIWPKNAKTLNRIYPIEWARAIHFPVMLYFVAFIIVHVALVFATGAMRNLNHMYAAQGSVDPNAYAANWTGFWIFFASLVVIGIGWIAARPLVVAPIAGLFGKVGR